ncbi:type III restriction-modification system endonuclease [Clostridium estertheticum]|uniref:type III restriction-modification system endonuclease n=1 Tax=Clostridium estertheticum TaxID=238834 RepID=UPI001C0E8BB1|nr:DEAD/DEAH box helicase family protein [Clostridium estertheticum]MBU3172490.1 DEAD/DEAH box helicase family protein [Clostridium estertheticum]
MKLKFKHQKFQADAATAVCDVFAGQPNILSTYIIDQGRANQFEQLSIASETNFTGFNNRKVLLSDDVVKANLRRVQRQCQIEPSTKLEGKYNLTIEMETGVGKTYTYIKTMFELNKRYGWSKFIVVIPSIAIREGVFKSFDLTCDHFAEEYNKKIRCFIYNSKDLTKIDKFANDSGINVMIINSQAFNARGKDARRIYMKMDSFRSRRPIDAIAATNPILIIDEPQSVEGAATKERLKDFKPLMTLRYSATHKKDSIYNLIYRLDALEAYNKRLVKKIAVKGISVSGTTATESYLYLEKINLYGNKPPTATLEFEVKRVGGVRKSSRIIKEGYNLYDQSGGLDEYKGYIVSRINGLTNTVEFTNGAIISSGDVIGSVNEEHVHRIQIRETIKTHLERERQLFFNEIKVLSLFFIDEVAKYRQYDENGTALNGEYAQVFEEEYDAALAEWQLAIGEDDYLKYLNKIKANKTHAGYFSIDKKNNRITNSKIGDKKENTSDDVSAYDLIMKDKERLLDQKEPVRFIFSHSALREGWDNPNVFQICTLKQSGSDVRKRQEVGRGLRLCVNNNGERMDSNVLGGDVHNVNVLTIIANESYDSFAKRLQLEMAEVVADRPREVTADLFENKVIVDANGLNEQVIDHKLANKLTNSLHRIGYIDDDNILTERYYEDIKGGTLLVAEEFEPYKADIINILDTIYNPQTMAPEDARSNNVELKLNDSKLQMKEFKTLWNKINSKSAYVVDFDTKELIEKSIGAMNKDLRVSQIFFKVEHGEMKTIKSKEALQSGEAFAKITGGTSKVDSAINTSVKYDLIGKIVTETGLTRSAVGEILKRIEKVTFGQFHRNPEEFIIKASNIINEQKATVIIEHISYNKLEEAYSTDIFTGPTFKGRLGVNAMQAEKHLYDHIIYDSKNEKKFATELDKWEEVAVYVKLPGGFYINTPVGKYNPDWAIAFHEGKVKHIYFVAETKGDLSSMQLRKVEELKVHCAREHFKKISSGTVKYDVVDSYDALLNEVMK